MIKYNNKSSLLVLSSHLLLHAAKETATTGQHHSTNTADARERGSQGRNIAESRKRRKEQDVEKESVTLKSLSIRTE